MIFAQGWLTNHSTVLRRWRDILIYAVIGAILAVPCALLLNASLDALLAESETLLHDWATFLRLCAIAGGPILIVRQTNFRLAHYSKLICWPPATAAVPLGLWLMVAGVSATEPQMWIEAGGATFQNCLVQVPTGASALLAALFLLGRLQSQRSLKAVSCERCETKIRTFEELEQIPISDLTRWLENECPIENEGADLFGASDRAARVFAALCQTRSNTEGKQLYQTVVVHGPFGSGKSTIMSFVTRLAASHQNPRYIFAHVNCWGFSSVSAQEHILDQAIAALSEHADCLSLRHLPSAYADAIGDSNSFLAAIANVARSPSSPVGVLQRLTPILQSINAHMVILIEDTDRNGSDFDQKQIEAMLYGFRKVERVSYVLTAGTGSEIEFPKIAEHIEFVPRITPKVCMLLMDRIRKHCLTNWRFIDPTSGQNRPPSLINDDREDIFRQRFARTPSWIGISATLVDSPRILKKTLSGILESWSRMHGEVDIDELIMLMVLRHAAPAAFDFLGDYRREFAELRPKQASTPAAASDQIAQRLSYLRQRWSSAVAKSGHDEHTLAKVLGELVYDSTYVTGVDFHGAAQRCQSIKGDRGDIYWERITAGSLLPNEIRDQDVLQAIRQAKETGDIGYLAEKMVSNSDFSELLLRFQKYSRPLTSKQILSASAMALDRMSPFKYGVWNEPTRRFILIKNLIEHACPNDEIPPRWLLKRIHACLPHRLRDADTLYWQLGRRVTHASSGPRIRKAFALRIRRSLNGLSEDEFAACFPPTYPWTLRHLVWIKETQENDKFLTGWRHWKWLAPMLLRGMARHPDIITPQVICAFGESNARGDIPTRFTFDEKSLDAAFGEQVGEALSLLAKPVVRCQNIEDGFALFSPLASKAAARLLKVGLTRETPTVLDAENS